MDGHKYLKMYILMYKYIANIVFNFESTFKFCIPLPPNFCPNFNVYPIFIL